MLQISADGQSDGTVPLSKEGPIHDLAWSPTGKEFIVVYGFMPAKATLFDMKCKPVFDFGTGSRNTVLWAPHGRFLVLGGFGNISGNMQFWDNNRKKMMAEVKAPGSTNYAWSPCSRFFLTATLFPRLRVDNGFKVWKYDGSLVHQEQVRDPSRWFSSHSP
jgi:translation initiation factor 2A